MADVWCSTQRVPRRSWCERFFLPHTAEVNKKKLCTQNIHSRCEIISSTRSMLMLHTCLCAFVWRVCISEVARPLSGHSEIARSDQCNWPGCEQRSLEFSYHFRMFWNVNSSTDRRDCLLCGLFSSLVCAHTCTCDYFFGMCGGRRLAGYLVDLHEKYISTLNSFSLETFSTDETQWLSRAEHQSRAGCAVSATEKCALSLAMPPSLRLLANTRVWWT